MGGLRTCLTYTAGIQPGGSLQMCKQRRLPQGISQDLVQESGELIKLINITPEIHPSGRHYVAVYQYTSY